MEYLAEGVVIHGRQTAETLKVGACHDQRGDEILVLGDCRALGDGFGSWNFECADETGETRFRAEGATEYDDSNALRHFVLLFVDS